MTQIIYLFIAESEKIIRLLLINFNKYLIII